MTIIQQKNNRSRRNSLPLLPALVAVGGACSLAVTPAAALELGEIRINSALGQPLRASIAYALNPNEQLSNYCIFLRPGGSGNGMPVLDQARISVTDSAIIVSGNTPVREPILSMQLAVDCPYTPHLLREYTFMIDPANPSFVERAARTATARPLAQQPAITQRPVTNQPAPVAVTDRRDSVASRPQLDASPISASSTYRVQPGDTVSTIVARIDDRDIGMWPAVNAIFEANPGAFIDNDVNRLIAGKSIQIPALVGNAPAAAEISSPDAGASAEAEPSAEAATSAYSAPAFIAPDESATVSTTTPEPVASDAAGEPAADAVVDATATTVTVDTSTGSIEATVPAADTSDSLQLDAEVAAPAQTDSPVTIIPDTIIDDDTAIRVVPAIGAPAAEAAGTNGAWKWLMWLGGAGLTLIIGLLLFGRTLRERFGSFGAGKVDISGRRADDDPTQKTRIIEDVDYNFEDAVNSQAISLDADLGEGTGLHDAGEIDVAEDYGFMSVGDASSDVDLEITAEAAAVQSEETSTDIIPPNHRSDVSTILEDEVPPEGDAADYDMSMIVDATKQPLGDDDDTAKDLQAIQVETITESEDDGGYTLSQEIDYEVLEQDYEDELTATQALNIEVEKAAMELAARMQDDADLTAEMRPDEPTNEMPAIEKTQEMEASDKTQEMEASGDTDAVATMIPEVSNPDQTAELSTNLPTSLLAENDETAAEEGSATTIELSAAGSDITVEMQVESGKVDTKKNRT
ncbi:MAG: type IV pilus assembly protein FimV [Woeseiaceae bacterium]